MSKSKRAKFQKMKSRKPMRRDKARSRATKFGAENGARTRDDRAHRLRQFVRAQADGDPALEQRLLHVAAVANANVLTDTSPLRRKSTDFLPPIVQAVDQCISSVRSNARERRLVLPNLHAFESISLYTDFCGDGDQSAFSTYSFLLCSYNPQEFEHEMRKIRSQFKLMNREIAYKKLPQKSGTREAAVRAALPRYIRSLDNLVPGLLCTVAVPRSLSGLLLGEADESALLLQQLATATDVRWKADVLQKALRVFHLSSYLIALLGRQGQKLFWMCDNDAILANGQQQDVALGLFRPIIDDYCSFQLGKMGWATPFTDRSEMLHHDLLSATDLAAGTFHRCVAQRDGHDAPMKESSEMLERWLGTSGIMLRKVNIVLAAGSTPTELKAAVMSDTGPAHGTAIPLIV